MIKIENCIRCDARRLIAENTTKTLNYISMKLLKIQNKLTRKIIATRDNNLKMILVRSRILQQEIIIELTKRELRSRL